MYLQKSTAPLGGPIVLCSPRRLGTVELVQAGGQSFY